MIGYRIPHTLEGEIRALGVLIEQYRRGEVDAVTLKAHRVPFGIYEQRTPGTYMVRVRCAAGIITPRQFAQAALLSRRYGNGVIHITTRQEIQIHDVRLEELAELLEKLRLEGLSTRGGGGNTVRNIIAPPDAGISRDELFDVTPHTVALTEFFAADPKSWDLPRKFKIAFSGSDRDAAHATLQDLGFVARIVDGSRGFRVFIAGGMGARPATGRLLFDFIPEEEIFVVALAARELFARHGNRKNRHSARLRFLMEKTGEEGFRELFAKELAATRQLLPPVPALRSFADAMPGSGPDADPVLVPVRLGDIGANEIALLYDAISAFGENVLRFTQEQNILLRNIPADALPGLRTFIREQLRVPALPLAGAVVSCAGASTCQLGICLSRGAAGAVIDTLETMPGLAAKTNRLTIHISGCPNACGRHWAADLGAYGRSMKKNGHSYPAYTVVAGARIDGAGSDFAGPVGEISARDLPSFIAAVVRDFNASAATNFAAYLEDGGLERMASLLHGRHKEIPDYADDPSYYTDWGATGEFSLAGRGTGECSAGIFDFIERDLRVIGETRRKLDAGDGERPALLTTLLFHSARMLLITRGVQEEKEAAVYRAFQELFIDTGIIDARYRPLLDAAIAGAMQEELLIHTALIRSLAEDIVGLYDRMDDSLRFDAVRPQPATATASRSKDLRGVACPMNFVKTKMELSKIGKGETLEILLDDGAPIENVPGSVRAEGHTILRQEKKDGYWNLVIVKG